MTPEEKAKELMEKFKGLVWGNTMFTRQERQKKAAIICVDEIIKSSPFLPLSDDGRLDLSVALWQSVRNSLTK